MVPEIKDSIISEEELFQSDRVFPESCGKCIKSEKCYILNVVGKIAYFNPISL